MASTITVRCQAPTLGWQDNTDGPKDIVTNAAGRKPMRRIGALLGVGALAAGGLSLAAPAAVAQNSQTFRDCSLLVQGFDPDFVQLFGVALSPQGALTVSPSQRQLQLEGSESSDPGDSAGHVTLKASISAPQVATKSVSGTGTGKVVLSVPLTRPRGGRTYTISWSATFDNGNHACPSPLTPENTTPKPFVVKVD
jgi:hypothetical protein